MMQIVDDEAEAREPVRRALEEHGAEVVSVRSADEALEAIRQQRPDVLVSDIGMPTRNGYELMRAIRGLPRGRGGGLPAIALTAFGTAEDRARVLKAGFMMHLAKPVEPSELIAAVAAMAGRQDPGSSREG
jgi:CheY-like chemotaxis protein